MEIGCFERVGFRFWNATSTSPSRNGRFKTPFVFYSILFLSPFRKISNGVRNIYVLYFSLCFLIGVSTCRVDPSYSQSQSYCDISSTKELLNNMQSWNLLLLSCSSSSSRHSHNQTFYFFSGRKLQILFPSKGLYKKRMELNCNPDFCSIFTFTLRQLTFSFWREILPQKRAELYSRNNCFFFTIYNWVCYPWTRKEEGEISSLLPECSRRRMESKKRDAEES